MKRSYLFKAVGVLIVLVVLFAFPKTGFAEENAAEADSSIAELLEWIPEFNNGDPFIPNLPSDLQPGEFYANLFAYEKTVNPDERFALIVSYAYSGKSAGPALNTRLNLILTEEIKYVDFYDEDLNQLQANVRILPSGEQEISFVLGSVSPGTIGNVIVVAKLDGELLDKTDQPAARAEVFGTGTQTASTENVVITPIMNPSDWMLMLYQDSPSEDPAPGGEVIYGVTLYGNSIENGLDLHNVTMRVTYPEHAVLMDAGGGEVDADNHTVTWKQEHLLVEEMAEHWITLKYPTEYYTHLSNVAGRASAVALEAVASTNVSGIEGTFSTTATLEHPFAAPSLKLGSTRFGESLAKATYCMGDVAEYTIYGVENRGNVSFKNLYITIEIPDDLFLQAIDTGKYNMDVNVKIQFQTAAMQSWQDWETVSSLKNTRLNVADLGFVEPVEKIRWVFSEGSEMIKPGFSGRETVKFFSNVVGNYGSDTDVFAALQAQTYEGGWVTAPSGDVLKIRTILPDDLPAWRKEIVETSFELLGRVEYYLGGKSFVIGWDDRWGDVRYNSSSGKTEPYGLDCSGFVVWVLINSGFDAATVRDDFGIATYYQWPNCRPVTVDELLPGDVVFRQPPTAAGMNHIGIVVGRDNQNNLLVSHCAGSYNTVVVTPYAGTFYYMRRPDIYGD